MAKNSIYAPVTWMIEHHDSKNIEVREVTHGHQGATDTKGHNLF
jgi:hypothetical protein